MHLSEHDVISPRAGDSDSIGAGAPCNEIEVTPAMIAAGMEEYSGRWLGLRDADDRVAAEMLAEAYRAMFRLRPSRLG